MIGSDDDLLSGWARIGAWAGGVTARTAQHRAKIGNWPVYTDGGRIVHARKSALRNHFSEKEAEATRKGKA